MKPFVPLVLLSALAAGCAGASAREMPAKDGKNGWLPLFDPLHGWTATGNPEAWTVDDGAIVCLAKKGGYLRTLEPYGDFVLSVDYKIEKGTNSGIFFRWSNLKDPVHTGIEMQVIDSHGKATPGKHDDGAIYDLVPPARNVTRPAGEWNTAVITCRGNLIMIELNGEKICEMDLDRYTEPGKNPDGTKNKFKYAWRDLPRKGYIGFQDHGGKAWFRNIRLKPLE